MNQPHLHLMVNHIPVLGIIFGVFALIWAIIRKSSEMRWAAIALFLVAGVFAVITFETGEHSEEKVEHLPGVSESIMHEHEKAADYAYAFALITAGTALLLAASTRFKPKAVKPAQTALLVLSIFTSTTMARTAYLGGQIRHSEIRSETNSNLQNADTKGEKSESNEKDDDDDDR